MWSSFQYANMVYPTICDHFKYGEVETVYRIGFAIIEEGVDDKE